MNDKGNRVRLVVTLVMTFLLTVSLIACSSNQSSNESSSAPASGPSDQQNQSETKSGGVLKVAASEDALNLGNPPTMMNQGNPNYAAPAVERLFRLNSRGEVEPFLVDHYEIADDQLSIKFELKQGIKFHDGSDFNAEVVKWNLDRYIATGRSELASVSSVEVIDEYTVNLVLHQYDALLLQYLATIPGLMVSQQSVEANDENWAEMHPVGTGPYQFVNWSRDQSIVYEKFDGYWGGEPALDGIEIVVIADSMTRTASFEVGDVDIVMNLDPNSATGLSTRDKFEVNQSDLATSLLGLLPDSANEDSVYSDLKVRQAVWHAIDFSAISNTMSYGYYEPTFQLASEGSAAYNPDVRGYPYDPETARQLLAEAGYANGFTTTLYGQNGQTHSDILTAVQGYLAEVGIKAEIDLMDQGRYFTMLTGGPEEGGWKDGLAIVPFTVVPNELGAYTRLMGPEVTAVRLPALYNSEELQNAIGKAAVESDPEQAAKLLQDIQKIATDDYATLFWIYAEKNISAKQSYVRDDNFNTPNWTPEKVWLDR